MELKGKYTMNKKQNTQALKKEWADYWGMKPHKGIGLTMLRTSLTFKKTETMTPDQKIRLGRLVKQYKRDPKCFDNENTVLKPGTRLVRDWKGKRHVVMVRPDGFSYNDKHFRSLSAIANVITGSRWNGYLFFGLKK